MAAEVVVVWIDELPANEQSTLARVCSSLRRGFSPHCCRDYNTNRFDISFAVPNAVVVLICTRTSSAGGTEQPASQPAILMSVSVRVWCSFKPVVAMLVW